MAKMTDVGRYILQKGGEMTAMKLQKLLFYSQAWHLVWDEHSLFPEDFQAWANGPVIPELYQMHRGMFKVTASLFDDQPRGELTVEERATIDKVMGFYGAKTAQWLSNLTHQEQPWLAARKGYDPGENCSEVISQAAIHEYYSAL